MKALTPFILIAVAIGLFVLYVHPTYQSVKEVRAESAAVDEILNQAKELEDLRDTLVEERRQIPEQDLNRLTTMVPGNVDNIKLLIEVDSIAARYGMIVRDAEFISPETAIGEEGANPDTVLANQEKDLGTLTLSFTVASPYNDFKNFISDLEKNLRLVDVQAIEFEVGEGGVDFYEYKLQLKTYWLTSRSAEI